MSVLAVFAYFTFTDAKGKASTTEVKLPLGLDIPEYIDAAQRFATIFVNHTLARLTQVEVCIGLSAGNSASVPDAASDVQEKGQFVFVADNAMNFVLHVPTFDESLVVANSDAIDQVAVAVDSFIDLMVTGDGTIVPVNIRDQDLLSVSYAREIFRRR